ncbi:CHAP domain-containing protein [Nocardioides montaniterrae]
MKSLSIRTLLITLLAAVGLTFVTPPAAHADTGWTNTCVSPNYGYDCVAWTGYHGQSTWGYPVDSRGHNCTNYAAYRLAQAGAANPGNLGNATDWDNNAAAKGFTVDHNPAVGSVAQWEGNTGPAAGVPEGHVAIVDAVTSSYIDISQDGWGGTTKTTRITTGGTWWPNHFIHIKDGGAPTDGSWETAFQANTGSLWTVGAETHGDWHLGMQDGTSPAVARLSGGGYESAFQANTGSLWVAGAAGTKDAQLGMMRDTSPAIAGLTNGSYEAAFQANTGNLWTVGSDSHGDWHLGMMQGTSPSIAALPGGGYVVAFQANTGNLYTTGTPGTTNWGLGMMRGTSPSVAALTGGGFQVAFQANTGSLWTVGAAGNKDWQLGMAPATSPSITAVTGGGFEAAFQANTGSLWTVGAAGNKDWQLGMKTRTSPAIAGLGSGGFQAAFQANTGDLWTVGSGGDKNWQLGMMRQTSPCITAALGGGCAPGATDLTAPNVNTIGSLPHFRTSTTVKLDWSGSDTGSGVAAYDVRYRTAPYSGSFGAYQYPAAWQGLTTAAATKTGLTAGTTYCFSVRARDNAGNTSGWKSGPCTTTALDDRALTGTGWTAKTGTGYFAGTFKTTSVQGRQLSRTGAQVRRIAVVATTCPTCGKVGVFLNGTQIGTADLYATTTRKAQIVTVPVVTLQTGTVTLRVLTNGKPVEIDGIGLSRS